MLIIFPNISLFSLENILTSRVPKPKHAETVCFTGPPRCSSTLHLLLCDAQRQSPQMEPCPTQQISANSICPTSNVQRSVWLQRTRCRMTVVWQWYDSGILKWLQPHATTTLIVAAVTLPTICALQRGLVAHAASLGSEIQRVPQLSTAPRRIRILQDRPTGCCQT